MTANVILEKRDPVREDLRTFSVYYGQAFEDARESGGQAAGSQRLDEDALRGGGGGGGAPSGPAPRQDGTLLYDRFHARTARSLSDQLPPRIEPDYVIQRFQGSISDDSNVRVHSVINVVFLFFKLVPLGKGNADAERFRRLRQEGGYAFPRVAAAPHD